MKTMGAAQFKAQCLGILDSVDPEGLVITKHGRPVAKLVPVTADPASMVGALRGTLRIKGSILSTGARWDAAS